MDDTRHKYDAERGKKKGSGGKNDRTMKIVAVVAALCTAAAVAVIAGYLIYNAFWRDDGIKSGTDGSVAVPTATTASTATPVPTATPAPTETAQVLTTYYVANCDENISLRVSPDTSSSVLRMIDLGEPVSFVEPAQNGFAKVIYNGVTGYALQAYLSPVPPAPVPTQQQRNVRRSDSGSAPAYYTYTDSDYSFSCPYPSDFDTYYVDDDFMRYSLTSPDGSATMHICATRNGNGRTPADVIANFKSTYGGSTDYENSGSDWCVVRTYRNGMYHYGYFKLTGGMIRGFEFHFDGDMYGHYDGYINNIYNGLDFY